jgi:hypothetical protein
MSDPVAANADLLKTTVSPAALAGIAKWYGKAGDVATAEIVSIDSKVCSKYRKASREFTSNLAEHDP